MIVATPTGSVEVEDKKHPLNSNNWFTPQPYTYQTIGAVRAAFQNHTLIADEPGLGKTIQALLIAAIIKPRRILIICPPSLISNWENETRRSGIAEHTPASTITTITSSTRTPRRLPAGGIVITSDTLATSRTPLARLLAAWQPGLLIYDEAHRAKNVRAKRTRTMLHLARKARKTVCLTGTPIVSSPLDVLPLLTMLDKTSYFPANFKTYYTRENYWGTPEPIPERMPDLHRRLNDHVWSRRTKKGVLSDLPPKTRYTQLVDIPDTQRAKAFSDVAAKLKRKGYTQAELQDHAKEFVSQMRHATGMLKIDPAADWITTHVEGTGRPLIVWCIHTEVIHQLADKLTHTLPHATVRTYYGATSKAERDATVTAFQAGKIDVLIAQITAAGVGLTLTRAQDALFVETEWTPALVTQAEDRIHRITQASPVTITTLIAPGTLDPIIHKVLTTKAATLDQLTPGSDHHVEASIHTEGASVTRLLAEIGRDIINTKGHHQ
jgi:SWI/SNF-related matrix-associated actin-dependent regulator 1 of chromatin subfamily A